MGLVYSVLRRFKKKVTTKETLEQIDEDIDKLQTSLKRNQQLKNKYVWLLILISLFLYIIFGAIFYLWFLPKTWMQTLLYIVPFLVFPFLVFLLKKLLHFIFVSRITKTSQKLDDLKKEKRKILENVMETETYKVAKEILEKFDPNRKLVEKESPIKAASVQKTPGSELRRRNPNMTGMQTPHRGAPQFAMHSTPMVNGAARMPVMQTPNPQQTQRFQAPNIPRAVTPRIPNAPILPRDRSVVDKIAEYFVGDGPSNRYALICSNCYSHNGMALAEEFEYMSYRCCYCGHLNPARKKRLAAPKEPPVQSRVEKSDTEADKNSESENTEEKAPNVDEENCTQSENMNKEKEGGDTEETEIENENNQQEETSS